MHDQSCHIPNVLVLIKLVQIKVFWCMQVKLNVQRTLAIELQRLSVQFRKQQKAYLNRLRQKNGPSGSGASFSVLDEAAGTTGREALDPEYDPGFNEIQVCLHNIAPPGLGL